MKDREAALEVDTLRVSLVSGPPIVDDVSFVLERGRVLGLVGESGSGKTTLGLAAAGYVRPGAKFETGVVRVAGQPVTNRTTKEIRALRGRLVSYVPQDPATALNPSMRIGEHVADRVRDRPKEQRDQLVVEALTRAELPTSEAFRRRYPHELSGGQQQRVILALAIVGEPVLVVLDEPTTGLDVVVQARILEEIARLRQELDVTIVFVSHDLAAVAAVADELAVMYAGRIVEQGNADELLRSPRHPYTIDLLRCAPNHKDPRRVQGIPGVALGVGEWPPGCPYAARCKHKRDVCVDAMPTPETVHGGHIVRCLRWREIQPNPERAALGLDANHIASTDQVLEVRGLSASHPSRWGAVTAAEHISFSISSGECVALVGESGSGKTTIARCVVGLHRPDDGTIVLDGKALGPLAGDRDRDALRRLQIVFQNPYESLNPRETVLDAIERPARRLRGLSSSDARTESHTALERVGLSARLGNRYPRDLSGGERQRVAIARALAAQPDLLICDEITSALDVSVQATVLVLLDQLRTELGLAMLFITHDLGVVANVADRVLVLDKGRIVEAGPTMTTLTSPTAEYTRTLIDAAPQLPTETRVSPRGNPGNQQVGALSVPRPTGS